MLDSFPEASEISIIPSFSGNAVRVKYVKQISQTDFSAQTSCGFC